MTEKARASSRPDSTPEIVTEEKSSGIERISRAPSEPRDNVRDDKNAADYNLRVIGPLVRYVSEVHGEQALRDAAREANVDYKALKSLQGWMSWSQCETLLQRIFRIAGSEENFNEACVYRFVESWGPFRYIAWALTPLFMYQGAVRANKTLSTVAEFSVETLNVRRVIVHYKSKKQESRLLCATRRVALANLPTFFGLPVARLQERKCTGWGDDCCEYDISWAEQKRWLPMAIGAGVGLGLAAILHKFAVDSFAALVLAPALGAALGRLFDARKNERASVTNTEEANAALQRVMAEEAEARREIMALGQRQRDWAALVEEAYATRLDNLRGVMKQAEEMQQARESTLLGFSHDLRNPLMVLASTVEFLRENGDALGDEGPTLIEDVEGSIAQMKRMLGDFVSAATSKQAIVRLRPQRLDVSGLTSSITRRLRALLQGRSIVPSVMQTRDAPEEIFFDPLVFDRVIDNLLTNAAKYTERGSIVVEVTGNDDFIIIKVSDSGRGIDEAELERIFQAGGSTKEKRAQDSFGVGLSVVVELLEQVGGSLEVMSQPGRGTTFWANFPIGSEATLRPSVRPSAPSGTNISTSSGGALSARVRIRKPPA
jgi:signal transduction histidine kinase